MMTATYSPEDNKLRLYASARLEPELYQRVRAAGFIWAPKQDLFVAPMWTPQRADLLIELCGEIGDEDTSLVERAEERSERFDEYSDKRRADADAAHAAVASIADGIPFGQPILVGHHSERHARKDAEKIQNGMRKAVKMWETSNYWTARAAGALRHAKYKERPDVRARRIKGLEAEKRKEQRSKDEMAKWLAAWNRVETAEQGRQLANYCHLTVHTDDAGTRWSAYDVLRPEEERYKACPVMTLEQVQEVARRVFPLNIAHSERWIAHTDNRLAYERALLDESGYTPPPKKASKAEKPLLNYSGAVSYRDIYSRGVVTVDAVAITKAELAKVDSNYKGTRVSACGTHRVRIVMNACIPSLRGTFGGDDNKRHGSSVVFVSDSKQHARPTTESVEDQAIVETMDSEREALAEAKRRIAARKERLGIVDPDAAKFDGLKQALKTGVQVVSAPQLFPTPVDVAARMVELAEVGDDHRVLEPSAGTGNIIRALRMKSSGKIVAVEINKDLVRGLTQALFAQDANFAVQHADFLLCNGDLGTFDRILMNPPFADASDVRHILHAQHMLNAGGKLVAICANGPRQEKALKPLASTWEELPAGTFEGTNVRTVLLVIDG